MDDGSGTSDFPEKPPGVLYTLFLTTAKMKTTSATTILASLVAFAEAGVLAPRATTTIRLCRDQNFGGCSSLTINTGACCTSNSSSHLVTLSTAHLTYSIGNFPGELNDAVSSVDTGR